MLEHRLGIERIYDTMWVGLTYESEFEIQRLLWWGIRNYFNHEVGKPDLLQICLLKINEMTSNILYIFLLVFGLNNVSDMIFHFFLL